MFPRNGPTCLCAVFDSFPSGKLGFDRSVASKDMALNSNNLPQMLPQQSVREETLQPLRFAESFLGDQGGAQFALRAVSLANLFAPLSSQFPCKGRLGSFFARSVSMPEPRE
jgi:hypothetical protein